MKPGRKARTTPAGDAGRGRERENSWEMEADDEHCDEWKLICDGGLGGHGCVTA